MIFECQAFLVAAFDLAMVECTTETVWLAEHLSGHAVPVGTIEEALLQAATYMDDAHWCAQVQSVLDLRRVEFSPDKVDTHYEVVLNVFDVSDPLTDSRLISLVRRALAYRRASGIVLTCFDNTHHVGRLSVRLGDRIYAKIAGRSYESSGVVTEALLEGLDTSGGSWASVLAAEAGAPLATAG